MSTATGPTQATPAANQVIMPHSISAPVKQGVQLMVIIHQPETVHAPLWEALLTICHVSQDQRGAGQGACAVGVPGQCASAWVLVQVG